MARTENGCSADDIVASAVPEQTAERNDAGLMTPWDCLMDRLQSGDASAVALGAAYGDFEAGTIDGMELRRIARETWDAISGD